MKQLPMHIHPLVSGFPPHLGPTESWVESPGWSSLLIYFMQSLVYICLSQSPSSSYPLPPPWCLYVCFLRLWLYFCFLYKIIYTNFSRFHIYALTYDICFSLSDLLHSVWQSLHPSMSVQMTQFCSLLWLNN